MAPDLLHGWKERDYVVFVELLAARRGFLDIWSANQEARAEVCREAQTLLDEIAFDDEEYVDAEIDCEIAAALEDYRLHVSIALQKIRHGLIQRNRELACEMAGQPRPLAKRKLHRLWQNGCAPAATTFVSALRPVSI